VSLSAGEWFAVIAGVIAYLVAEARGRRWLIRQIVTSDNARKNGTWQSAVSDQYLRDAARLNADLDYFGWGIILGIGLFAFALFADSNIGWACFGLLVSVFSFGAVGARAIYGDIRLRSIRRFYGRLGGRWRDRI
jgi:hypothetical protein